MHAPCNIESYFVSCPMYVLKKTQVEIYQCRFYLKFGLSLRLNMSTRLSHYVLMQSCSNMPLLTYNYPFNPRPVRAFLITRNVGGGMVRPPWRSATDGRRASRKKPVDASRRDLAIAHIVFSPRSTFDLVMSGQRSNFREKSHFFIFTRS